MYTYFFFIIFFFFFFYHEKQSSSPSSEEVTSRVRGGKDLSILKGERSSVVHDNKEVTITTTTTTTTISRKERVGLTVRRSLVYFLYDYIMYDTYFLEVYYVFNMMI